MTAASPAPSLAPPRAPIAPPTPRRPARQLGFFEAVRAFYVNPLEFWPETLFDAPYIVDRFVGRTYVNVAEPALARSVLLDDAAHYGRSAITSRVVGPALRDGLLTSQGEAWRRQRRIAAPSFRTSALASFEPAMRAAGERAGARLAAQAAAGDGVVEVMGETIRATFDVIMETLLDSADAPLDRERTAADVGAFIEGMGRIDPLDLLMAPTWLPRPWKASGHAAIRRFRAAALAVVRAKRARLEALGDGADPARLGLTDRLIRAADPEAGAEAGLTDGEVVDNVMTFISAGHETTSLALTWTLYLLSLDLDLQDRLAEEAPRVSATDPDAAPLIEQTLKEAMRLFPPAAATARSVVEPVQLGPLALKPGDHVSVAIFVTHRHRGVWDAPDLFDPSRFAPDAPPVDRFAYLPFGAGPHICIGLTFAMMEARLILAEILSRVRVSPAGETPPEPVLRVTLRPKGGMPLRVAPR